MITSDPEGRPTLTPEAIVAVQAAELLRLPRNEVQLTKALAALMRKAPDLAHRMVTGLVSSVPEPPRIKLPRSIDVEPENPTLGKRARLLRTAEQATGRIDWRLMDAGSPPGSRFQLLVEVKISSGFGVQQLQRYLTDDRLKRAEWGRVIALTRDPNAVPREVRGDSRWLGIVRWSDLLPRLRLMPDELPTAEAVLWDALLDVAQPAR